MRRILQERGGGEGGRKQKCRRVVLVVDVDVEEEKIPAGDVADDEERREEAEGASRNTIGPDVDTPVRALPAHVLLRKTLCPIQTRFSVQPPTQHKLPLFSLLSCFHPFLLLSSLFPRSSPVPVSPACHVRGYPDPYQQNPLALPTFPHRLAPTRVDSDPAVVRVRLVLLQPERLQLARQDFAISECLLPPTPLCPPSPAHLAYLRFHSLGKSLTCWSLPILKYGMALAFNDGWTSGGMLPFTGLYRRTGTSHMVWTRMQWCSWGICLRMGII